MPAPDERRLAFFVREPWPSVGHRNDADRGQPDRRRALLIRSELADGGVVFGDGIESDRLAVGWGQRVTVGVADRVLELVL